MSRVTILTESGGFLTVFVPTDYQRVVPEHAWPRSGG